MRIKFILKILFKGKLDISNNIMDGVHFSSNDLSFFKSKNAKSKLKKTLKDLFLKDEDNFINEVQKITSDLENKYLKQDKLFQSKLEVKLENGRDQNKKISVKLFREEDEKEINRQRLKNKLKEIKK